MRPEAIRTVLLWSFVLATTASAPTAAVAQGQLPPGEGHRASAVETAQLPKFCWSQYTDLKGPEYEIRGCGVGMNHYCWGLVELLRASKTFGNPAFRTGYLQKAKGNTQYTIRAMEKYPTCWLRPHVENTYQQIEIQLRVNRGK